MRIVVMAALAALAACATVKNTLRPVEPFSEAALFTLGASYIDQRYKPPAGQPEFLADLAAAGYRCLDGVCVRDEPTGPGCAMRFTIRLGPPVQTNRAPVCAGVVSPP